MPAALAGVLRAGWVDLLKIDCEGAEGDVLATAGPGGLARVERVALEYHGSVQRERAAALLASSGFEVEVALDAYDEGIGYLYARRRL